MKIASRKPAPVTMLGLGVVALLLVLAGTGGAVAGALITGKQIKNDTITTADIKNKTITNKDLAGSALPRTGATGPVGPAGAPGAVGPAGVPGATGPQGADGLTRLRVVRATANIVNGSGRAWVFCDADERVVSGGWHPESGGATIFRVYANYSYAVKRGAVASTEAILTGDTPLGSGWLVDLRTTEGNDAVVVNVLAYCAKD